MKNKTCKNCGHEQYHHWTDRGSCELDCACKKFEAEEIIKVPKHFYNMNPGAKKPQKGEDKAEMHKPMKKLTKEEIKIIEKGLPRKPQKGCKEIKERLDRFRKIRQNAKNQYNKIVKKAWRDFYKFKQNHLCPECSKKKGEKLK